MFASAQTAARNTTTLRTTKLLENRLNWTMMKRWLKVSPQQDAVRDSLLASQTLQAAANDDENPEVSAPRARIPRSNRAHPRTREWRRRALMRKGARMYSTIPWSGTFASLAMLDEEGIVIDWYERANDWDGPERSPMNGHVSKLYTREDVGLGVPMRELCRATTQGESRQTGWRLGLDGRRFWATTTIRAVRLRDGRLQGFSHLIDRLADTVAGCRACQTRATGSGH